MAPRSLIDYKSRIYSHSVTLRARREFQFLEVRNRDKLNQLFIGLLSDSQHET
jgi:hypothetical protein